MKIYDLIIIGAGPAGIAAGIYAKNFGIDCLIIGEKEGGMINAAYKVENYPGIFNVTGEELLEKFKAHQEYLRIPSKKENVEKVIKKGNNFEIISNTNKYEAKSIILAFGTQARKLEIKNIDKFENKGVYYQSGDSASLFKDKTIAIIGGANSAVMKATIFAKDARKVYLIYRRESLRADAIWIERLNQFKNVEIIYSANVVELKGKDKLTSVILNNGKELEIEGLFIETGTMPDSALIKNLGITINEQGYIEVEKNQATNVDGVFAAGDITTGSNGFRQIITACAEGAIAALGVLNFINKKK